MEEMNVVTKSKHLVNLIYKICKQLPKDERYIIIPQICRASISVGSNIVEGQQRSDKDFLRFITISRGSLYEVKLQLEMIQEIHKDRIRKDEYQIIYELIDQIGKMTHGLMLKLRQTT